MLHWESSKTEICRAIEQRTSLFKIVLKTKNDPFFLERWITHHLDICGSDSLIIFDNGSTLPEVSDVYNKYKDALQCFSFGGFHNLLHHTDYYPSLYESLHRSAKFYAFLDTDEFLIAVDQNCNVLPSAAVGTFIDQKDSSVLPAVWLHNVLGSESKYSVGTSIRQLSEGLAWGKPVIRADTAIKGFVNHNTQVSEEFYDDRCSSGLFLLHKSNLSPAQRIRTNMNKLVARGVILPSVAAEDAVVSLAGNDERNIRQYVSEIKKMLALGNVAMAESQELALGQMALTVGRPIRFNSEAERSLFTEVLHAGPDWTRHTIFAGGIHDEMVPIPKGSSEPITDVNKPDTEPHLFGTERRLFDQALADYGARYSEFGMGGTTVLAVQAGCTVVSVESDPAWVERLRSYDIVAAAISAGRASLLYADIGAVAEWGRPTDRSRIADWPDYIRLPWKEWCIRREQPSLIFVDGRFRVACCLSVIVALGVPRAAGEEPRVLLHDFDAKRPFYQRVLDFFEVEAVEHSLNLLRIRRDASPIAALTAMLESLLDPR